MTDKPQTVQSLISELRIESNLLNLSDNKEETESHVSNINELISSISSNCDLIAKEKTSKFEEV